MSEKSLEGPRAGMTESIDASGTPFGQLVFWSFNVMLLLLLLQRAHAIISLPTHGTVPIDLLLLCCLLLLLLLLLSAAGSLSSLLVLSCPELLMLLQAKGMHFPYPTCKTAQPFITDAIAAIVPRTGCSMQHHKNATAQGKNSARSLNTHKTSQ
jgi:hypothetical protein